MLPRAISRAAQPRSRVPPHRAELPLLLERRCALLGNRRLCRPCGLGLSCRGLFASGRLYQGRNACVQEAAG